MGREIDANASGASNGADAASRASPRARFDAANVPSRSGTPPLPPLAPSQYEAMLRAQYAAGVSPGSGFVPDDARASDEEDGDDEGARRRSRGRGRGRASGTEEDATTKTRNENAAGEARGRAGDRFDGRVRRRRARCGELERDGGSGGSTGGERGARDGDERIAGGDGW